MLKQFKVELTTGECETTSAEYAKVDGGALLFIGDGQDHVKLVRGYSLAAVKGFAQVG